MNYEEMLRMRQQSRTKISVRGVVVGGDQVPVCLPLVATHEEELIKQAKELTRLKADIIEWRVDGFGSVQQSSVLLDKILTRLREVIGQIPLLFTCRIKAEGGMADLSDSERLELNIRALDSGMVDLVDVELANDSSFLDAVCSQARKAGVPVILSSHNFTRTPAEEEILATLEKAYAVGADIAKIAVMPNSFKDVLTLLSATDRARNSFAEKPLITIAMGEMGKISRFAGGLFGSDVTFGVGQMVSAPGQVPVEELRQVMSLVYQK